MLNPIYEDEHLLALDKPAGLLSVPGRGADKQDCLAARAQQRWPGALVVHRLDMATSGLMLLARSPDVQRRLSKAFANRLVHKRYLAVVLRDIAPPVSGWAEIDLPIALDWPNRPRSQVDMVHGKPSLTRWRLAPPDWRWRAFVPADSAAGGALCATRLELAPVTGRSHQLRVHLQAIGHPIVGDPLYGLSDMVPQASRLLLHAWQLDFTHPVSGTAMHLEAPSPL